MHRIKTFNAISPRGLAHFTAGLYEIDVSISDADAILLRSHKLDTNAINGSLRAVARAGAGVNNVPVEDCTQRGIVVFNTPGANANAVKELVLCGMLLASRRIIPGIAFANSLADITDHAELSRRMELEKKRFGGKEIAGKTLGVVGLGAIGSLVADMAIKLGMKVQGFDPALSVDAAWRLPGQVKRIENLTSLVASSDYISLHLPVLETTRKLFDAAMFSSMREGTCLLNFARDEIVDPVALKKALGSPHLRCYVSDFPRPELMASDKLIAMPHIGATTAEAEENCAIMAVEQLMDFLEHGNISNSVNFPAISLERTTAAKQGMRLAIANRNVPRMLGQILSVLADQNINVIDMINKSRDDIAYNLIDLESAPTDTTIKAITDIQDVIKVTLL